MSAITIIKEKIYHFFVKRNWNIEQEYETYVTNHPDEHNTARYKHWILLARLNYHYRILRKSTRLLSEEELTAPPPERQELLYYRFKDKRLSVDELCEKTEKYDIVSFDIFDTAIYRKVNKPDWIFHIMALEMGVAAFQSMRKKAERSAREMKEDCENTREVTLSEIYDELCSRTNIDRKWMEREIELEIETSAVNPYIYEVYRRMTAMGKRIIFVSDMYLPADVITKILKKNGYTEYEKLFLSNEYGVNKGTGKLQSIVRETYPDNTIIHIGDNYYADVDRTQAAGIDAVFNRNAMPCIEEPNMETLSGAVYNAVINNSMNNGIWKDSLYYDHGFRVGGILTLGYCDYINKLVREKQIEKVLFCARDCFIIQKLYDQMPEHAENAYLQTSRYAMLNLTAEKDAYEFANRCIMPYIYEFRSTRTLGDILTNCGFDYLVPYLKDNDLEQLSFPQSINETRIEKFILDHIDIVKEHNREEEKAAADYFTSLTGNARRILVVDIGWTGTCISLFKYFMENCFPERNYEISGVLLCSSPNPELIAAVEDSYMDSYIFSPLKNLDYAKIIWPGEIENKMQERLKMPLECLYTSNETSLLGYRKKSDGTIGFVRRFQIPPNPEEIEQMQAGIMDFARLFRKYTDYIKASVVISPYTAFQPYATSLKYEPYNYAVFKNFVYDIPALPFENNKTNVFISSLYDNDDKDIAETSIKDLFPSGLANNKTETDLSETSVQDDAEVHCSCKKILFISQELSQSGSPRSLLRMSVLAKHMGYGTEVWSEIDGLFRIEFESKDIPVRIVSADDLSDNEIQKEISGFDMAVCNTILTDAFVRTCSKLIPTVWYIREATNIPDFIRGNWDRKYTLENSLDIYCVSDYAAAAIRKYTKKEVRVIRNCVEDEVEFALDHVPGSDEKIKFVQFGTMELRKGYDVLISAYQSMPPEYREKSELYFAGRFINHEKPYCSYIFSKINADPNIHYLGVVRGKENKIRTLSGMDVVVVASRDESCSLVALEGAMLSKPLIVTENVGAKYIVNEDSGYIVNTADAESLKQAMMKMIDQKEHLAAMGDASREQYNKLANMQVYEESMRMLFSGTEHKKDPIFQMELERYNCVFNSIFMNIMKEQEQDKLIAESNREENVIISLTSHPLRITTVSFCIKSLLAQTTRPQKILLWLAKPQFPGLEKDLPEDLVKLAEENDLFEIRWTEDDLKPHKKYYYVMQEYPDLPVITVDDDIIYNRMLVKCLMDSYRKFPDCISAMRTHLITFKSDGTPRSYENWIKGYGLLKDTPSAQLLPTGVGGVLYPPHSVPESAFDKRGIEENCLFCDDLWLKIMTLHNGYLTVLPEAVTDYQIIDGTQGNDLWIMNDKADNYDVSLKNTLSYYNKTLGDADALLARIRRDRAL